MMIIVTKLNAHNAINGVINYSFNVSIVANTI